MPDFTPRKTPSLTSIAPTVVRIVYLMPHLMTVDLVLIFRVELPSYGNDLAISHRKLLILQSILGNHTVMGVHGRAILGSTVRVELISVRVEIVPFGHLCWLRVLLALVVRTRSRTCLERHPLHVLVENSDRNHLVEISMVRKLVMVGSCRGQRTLQLETLRPRLQVRFGTLSPVMSLLIQRISCHLPFSQTKSMLLVLRFDIKIVNSRFSRIVILISILRRCHVQI